MTSIRLVPSRDTWRTMLAKLDLNEKQVRELPEQRILARARESLTKWELALFADELKQRRGAA